MVGSVRFGVISVRGLGLLECFWVEFRVYKELSAVGPPPKRAPAHHFCHQSSGSLVSITTFPETLSRHHYLSRNAGLAARQRHSHRKTKSFRVSSFWVGVLEDALPAAAELERGFRFFGGASCRPAQ